MWNWTWRCDREHRNQREEGRMVQHEVREISLWPSLILLP